MKERKGKLFGSVEATLRKKDIMESARQKVKRANKHLKDLKDETSVLPRDLYSAEVRHRSVALLAHPDGDYLTYTPKESISKYFAATLGDAVNNLRESLEVWTNTAIRVRANPGKYYFPVSEERAKLEVSRNFGKVKKAFPELADFIATEIEPCRDTNLILWSAGSLCNDNKHNDLIPVVTTSQVTAKLIKIGNVSIDEMNIVGNADSKFDLIKSSYQTLQIFGKVKVRAELHFPPGAILENLPVIDTIEEMSREVSGALDKLEEFIGPYCA